MPCQQNDSTTNRHHFRRCLLAMTVGVVALSVGCQDGPMYSLKEVNPYFTMKEWPSDEEIGVTDHERREEMMRLASSIERLPIDRQKYWLGHLSEIMKNDENAEMRRLAVNAAGRVKDAQALPVIQTGLDDSSLKVRMEACRALGRRGDDESALMLAEAVGSETEIDVRHAAMEALGNYESKVAIDSLRIALNDRNPATRSLAIKSLRGSTGKDYGDSPDTWIAVLDGKTPEPEPVRIADRIRGMF